MKAYVMIPIILLAVGLLAFVVGMSFEGWDFSVISNKDMVTNQYEWNETVKDITVRADAADITFLPAKDNVCRVVCYEHARALHTVELADGMLDIRVEDNKRFYEYMVDFSHPKVTVYLPAGKYGRLLIEQKTGDVTIRENFTFDEMNIDATTADIDCFASAEGQMKLSATTGDITLKNVTAGDVVLSVTTGDMELEKVKSHGDMSISLSTGDAELENVECESITVKGTTADISMDNVISTGKWDIRTTTGDVTFERCDAGEMYIRVRTGKVRGSLLSEKVFLAESTTGRVDVPKTIGGGRCEITTTTGSIKVTLE